MCFLSARSLARYPMAYQSAPLYHRLAAASFPPVKCSNTPTGHPRSASRAPCSTRTCTRTARCALTPSRCHLLRCICPPHPRSEQDMMWQPPQAARMATSQCRCAACHPIFQSAAVYRRCSVRWYLSAHVLPLQDQWSPCQSVSSLLTSVQSLLTDPNCSVRLPTVSCESLLQALTPLLCYLENAFLEIAFSSGRHALCAHILKRPSAARPDSSTDQAAAVGFLSGVDSGPSLRAEPRQRRGGAAVSVGRPRVQPPRQAPRTA